MVYLHFHHAFLEYTQNNLKYPPGGSNLSFHVGANILNLLLLYEIFMFLYV